MSNPNGYVLYEGPSELDGAPIVVIAVGFNSASTNSKTGGMIQTYVLRADVAPTEAVKTGADASICGACPHRGNGDGSGRTCYVVVFQGPLVVYKTYKRGKYPPMTDWSLFDGRQVRFGAYGDPAAAPLSVWDAIAERSAGNTGYTHQWRDAPTGFARYLMASADTVQDRLNANSKGYRTFRVALPGDPVKLKGEATCPASEEAGRKLQCSTCMACHGTAKGRRGDITIQAHGGAAVMSNVQKRAMTATAA